MRIDGVSFGFISSAYDNSSPSVAGSVMPQLSSSSNSVVSGGGGNDLLSGGGTAAGAALSQAQQQQQQPSTTSIHLNPLLGVAPLGPQPLSKEHSYQLGQ